MHGERPLYFWKNGNGIQIEIYQNMDIGSSYVQGVQLWEFETEDTPTGNHDISAKQLKPMSNMYLVIRNEK